MCCHYGFVRSPINYVGSKYRLLPQIIPLFPKRISTFVDLFCGSCTVAINVVADTIRCNDANSKLIELHKIIRDRDPEDIIQEVKARIAQYRLSKTNEEGYAALRKYYNKHPNPVDLFVLLCYSYNYVIRFNSKGQFNNTLGVHKSCYRHKNGQELRQISRIFKRKNAQFASRYFADISLSGLGNQDFVYADPPYLITEAEYCKFWTVDDERRLYAYLDDVDAAGVKFALSNVTHHKGKSNKILINWAKNYNLIKLNCSYANCNSGTMREDSQEVLVTNYEKPRGLFG